MTVRIDDGEYRRRLIAGLEQGLGQQGDLLVRHVKEKISRTQPLRYTNKGRAVGLDPSKEFEPPKRVTGELRNSIVSVVETDPGAVTLGVGSNVSYAKMLELGTSKMRPRPYLRTSLAERFEKLVAGVARELRRSLGQ